MSDVHPHALDTSQGSFQSSLSADPVELRSFDSRSSATEHYDSVGHPDGSLRRRLSVSYTDPQTSPSELRDVVDGVMRSDKALRHSPSLTSLRSLNLRSALKKSASTKSVSIADVVTNVTIKHDALDDVSVTRLRADSYAAAQADASGPQLANNIEYNGLLHLPQTLPSIQVRRGSAVALLCAPDAVSEGIMRGVCDHVTAIATLQQQRRRSVTLEGAPLASASGVFYRGRRNSADVGEIAIEMDGAVGPGSSTEGTDGTFIPSSGAAKDCLTGGGEGAGDGNVCELSRDVVDAPHPVMQARRSSLFQKLHLHAPDVESWESWSFNVWGNPTESNIALGVRMFANLGALETLHVTPAQIGRFLRDVHRGYHPNPYHNFDHAMDVMQTCYVFLRAMRASEMLSHLDVAVLLLAAAGHDIDHPGVTNDYLVKSSDPLAMLYNDVSVLENHHAACLWQLIRKHSLLVALPPDTVRLARKKIVDAVLNTDMARHFVLVSKLQAFVTENELSSDSAAFGSRVNPRKKLQLSEDQRQFVVSILLHNADISNPCKPWDISKKWSDLIAEEFYLQGDLERAQGLPISANMDINNPNQTQMACGFIDYIIEPSYACLQQLLPLAVICYEQLKTNRRRWADIKEEEEEARRLAMDDSANSALWEESELAADCHGGDVNVSAPTSSHVPSAPRVQRSGTLLSLASGNRDREAPQQHLPSLRRRFSLSPSGEVEIPSSFSIRQTWFQSTSGSKRKKSSSSLLDADGSDVVASVCAEVPHTGAHDDARDAYGETDGASVGKAGVSAMQRRVLRVVDGAAWTAVSVFCTLVALFGGDIVEIAFDASADLGYSGFVVAVIAFFVADIVLRCYAEAKYALSFFFWVDVLGTVMILPDLVWVSDWMFGVVDLTVARGARIARVGARTSRVGRLPRALRFLPWIRTLNDSVPPTPSRLGAKIAELISRRVVAVVLAVLIAFPLLQYNPTDTAAAMETTLLLLSTMSPNTSRQLATQLFIQSTPRLLSLSINGSAVYGTQAHDLRSVEIESYAYTFSDGIGSSCDIDARHEVQVSAGLNIVQTAFFMALLAIAAWAFSRDARTLVVGPFEAMLQVVKKVAFVLAALRNEDDTDVSSPEIEASFILSAISKMAGLLTVGFGEAGTGIIEKNLSDAGELQPMVAGTKVTAIFGFCDIRRFTDATEVLQEDVMIFVNSLAHLIHKQCKDSYGFPNKNVGDAFLLVWKLDQDFRPVLEEPGRKGHSGDGGKGDGAGVPSVYPTRQRSAMRLSTVCMRPIVDTAADGALEAFVVVVEELELLNLGKPGVWFGEAEFVKLERIRAAIPAFNVDIGFGLHFGWAIEGAIGSRYKIDCSYLSPHVNTSSRLEAATKQYGSPILMSGEFVELLSPPFQQMVRKIDRVTVRGSKTPLDLYTYDFHTYVWGTDLRKAYGGMVSHNPDALSASNESSGDDRDCARDKRATKTPKNPPPQVVFGAKKGLEDGGAGAAEDDDPSDHGPVEDYARRFSEGVAAYIAGTWDVAAKRLNKCRKLAPRDTPVQVLLAFMEEHNFTAPADWPGHRALKEK
eukprot:Opistho-2@32871